MSAKKPFFDESLLASIRVDMLRFARLQLHDQSLAEDAVQEALTSAYISRDKFQGKSQLKTWLFSILRYKIIDIIRQNVKKNEYTGSQENPLDQELFDERGHWLEEATPTNWQQPDQDLEDENFWKIFQICMDHLPEATSRVFSMREFLGLKTSEICQQLGLTESNCWVILHRARSQLRLCLEREWIN